MRELGEYLQDVRRSNGVSLEETASDLNVDYALLENIEEGNIRAFKDVYYLKDLIKEYAKYLGLDPLKVQEEFNDFLFEHTSKISLDDIMEAKKKKEEEEKKIKSPYTKEYKKKIKRWPIVLAVVFLILVIFVSIIVIKTINKDPIISSELKGIDIYEYTY